MSFMTPHCPICGRNHGTIAHERVGQVHFSSLIAANTDFKHEAKPAARKRMSASEAMAVTKVRYKETLDYLA